MQEKKSYVFLWLFLGGCADRLASDLNDFLKSILPNAFNIVWVSGFHIELTLIFAFIITFILITISFFLGALYPFTNFIRSKSLLALIPPKKKYPVKNINVGEYEGYGISLPLPYRISYSVGSILPFRWLYRFIRWKKKTGFPEEESSLQKRVREAMQKAKEKHEQSSESN